jgi:lipopolysaccharide export system protein LptC
VTFGYGTNPGLVVTNGTLTSLDMTLTSDVTVAGVAITTKGLRFGYTAANSQYTLAGTATAAVAKFGTVGVTFGYGANPGLVVTNGSLDSLDMTLNSDVTIAGVTITTKNLEFKYAAATSQYSLLGTATAAVNKLGTVGVTFGYGTSPGMVVTNGALTSLDMTLTSNVTVAGVGITTKGLRFGYTSANSQYTLGGTATATVTNLGTLGVTFGYGTKPGLVVTNGSLTSLDMTLNSDVNVSGVAITTKGLEFAYTAANSQYSLAGTATATVAKLGTLGVTFGYGTSPGLVVTNGSLTSLDMTLNTDVNVAGVAITTKGLRFGYTAATNRYTLAGTATASVAKLGNLGVTFGYGSIPGLVVTNGTLTSLDMTLNSDITVAGVKITTKGLRFGYTAADSRYTLAGTATASVAKLGTLGVTFGYGANPGLVVTNGTLSNLDMTLNTDVTIAGVTITTKGLRFTYTAANSQYTLAGTATASVAKLGNLGVTFGYGTSPGLVVTNGSLDRLDMTLNSDVTVGSVAITTKGLRFTYTAADSQYTLAGTAAVSVLRLGSLSVTFGYGTNPGLVVTNGSLDRLDMTLNSDIRAGSLTFSTKGLRFTYTAANSQYTLTGTASVNVLRLGSLSVTFGYGGNPGLVVTNGSLDSLDLTLNTNIRVNTVTIRTQGLRFTYTAATDRYTLAGTAGVTILGIGDVSVTFGYGGNPGLVITNGSLDSLDLTLNSRIRV